MWGFCSVLLSRQVMWDVTLWHWVSFHVVLEDWCAFICKVKQFWTTHQVTKCHNPRTWVLSNTTVRTSSVAIICGPHSLFWNSHFLCLVLRMLMRWLFRRSSLFPSCSYDSSQRSILVSCQQTGSSYYTNQTEPAQWCCVELRPQPASLNFLNSLSCTYHQYNIHIKYLALCVTQRCHI